MKPKVIAIAGPTASGKTKMAIELAKKVEGEIISADSRLVYKGFDIVSAKPTIEEREGIPQIISKGKTPVIAGGTGLYFRVLLENYDLPRVEANPELREELNLREKEDLLEELKRLDLKGYEEVKTASKRKIVRTLEISKILGKPYSEVISLKEPEFEVEWRMPDMPSREWLYDRINKRVDIMLENGAVEETKNLLEKHGRIKNLVCTIGYKEIISYLDGEATLEEAADKLKQHTRNYAKRQLTWFRKNPFLEEKCGI